MGDQQREAGQGGGRKVVLAVMIAVALSGGWSAWRWWSDWRFFQATDDAYVHGDISVISAKIGGYVRGVSVSDNQAVTAGTVLVVLDDGDYRARVDQTVAAIEVQQAALVSNAARQDWQRSVIDQASSQVFAAEAEQRRADQELARVRALTSDAWASRQRLETAVADQAKAAAALARSRAALEGERRQSVVLEAARREIEAALHLAQAQAAAARDDLANTVIRAPVGGIVANRAVQPGVLARPGVPLLAVVPLNDLTIDANFKETQLQHMRPGQGVSVTIDAFPGQSLEGRVDSIAPASGSRFSLLPPENATGNFTKIVQRIPVRISLSAGHPVARLIRPGMSAVVSVDTRGVM